MTSVETPNERSSRLEREEWARFESTVAATLTLAVLGTAQEHPLDQVIRAYGDMIQRLRSVDALSPLSSAYKPRILAQSPE